MTFEEVFAFEKPTGVKAKDFGTRVAKAAISRASIVRDLCRQFPAAFPAGFLAEGPEVGRIAKQVGLAELPVPVDSLKDHKATATILLGGAPLPSPRQFHTSAVGFL